MPYRYTSLYLDNPIVRGRALDILWPERAEREVSLFFIHGGGWKGGHREGFHPILRALNERGFVCGSAGYRLEGADIFDQLADVRHAYLAFVDELSAHGRPPKVVVYGCSAGAHLAALLALAQPGQCGEPLSVGDWTATDESWTLPAGVALQSTPVTFEPWDDMFPHAWADMQRIVRRPYAEAPELYRAVSPVQYIGPHTPPVFLMQAENEHIFSNALEDAFAKRLEALGRPVRRALYRRVEHGFFYALDRPQQRQALNDLAEFAEWAGGLVMANEK